MSDKNFYSDEDLTEMTAEGKTLRVHRCPSCKTQWVCRWYRCEMKDEYKCIPCSGKVRNSRARNLGMTDRQYKLELDEVEAKIRERGLASRAIEETNG